MKRRGLTTKYAFSLIGCLLLLATPLAAAWLDTTDPVAPDAGAGTGTAPPALAETFDASEAYVTMIAAEASGTNVVVSWVDLPTSGVSYTVYRNIRPINTDEGFATANIIATVKEGVGTYIDTPPPGAYYYAVTATVGGKEYRVSIVDHSYTTTPVTVSLSSVKKLHVTDITAVYQENTKMAIISWKPIPGLSGMYYVYRNTHPISNVTMITQGTLITKKRETESVALDKSLLSGKRHYYAVFIEIEGELRAIFVPDETYTTTPLTLPGQAAPTHDTNTAPVAPPVTNTPPVPTNTPASNAQAGSTNRAMPTNAMPPASDTNAPRISTDPIIVDDTGERVPTETPAAVVTQATSPLYATRPPGIHVVSNIRVSLLPYGSGTRIEWDFADYVRTPFTFAIYRNAHTPLSNASLLYAPSSSVVVIAPYESMTGGRHYTFFDTNVLGGTTNYYAVLIANGSSFFLHTFTPGGNYSISGAVVPKINTTPHTGGNEQALSTVTNNEEPKPVVSTNTVSRPPPGYTNAPSSNSNDEEGEEGTVSIDTAGENGAPSVMDAYEQERARREKERAHERTLFNVISSSFYNKRYDRAIDEMTAILTHEDDLSEKTRYLAHLFIGRSYLEQGEYYEALARLRKTERLFPASREEVAFWIDKAIKGLARREQ